jgi:hypothetical protein
VFSALRGYPDEPIGRASWAGTVKGKTKGGFMHKAGEARCAITPMNGMTALGYVSRNGKETVRSRTISQEGRGINTRSVNLLGAS